VTPWALTWTPEALDDVARLPRDHQARIVRRVERWADSGHGDIRTVQHLAGATHRLRVGGWRVLVALDSVTSTATILRVLPRGSAYRP
jgi:mRNA-degrading endonuclease RelE of RelBE toxin-antitoxin system